MLDEQEERFHANGLEVRRLDRAEIVKMVPGVSEDVIAANFSPMSAYANPLKAGRNVLEAAKKFHQQDEAKVEAAKNGTSNRAWVMKTLQAKNTEFIDGAYGE